MQILDDFDRKLLTLVQRDATLTGDALAEAVGLSASAAQRRLKRLAADGVIVGQIAVIDPRKVGRPTTLIVGLEIERERPELIARLRGWLAAEEAIQQVFYVTGSADFVLVVTARDIESYDALMTRLMTDNPNVRRFTTNVALSVLKRGLFVPVDGED